MRKYEALVIPLCSALDTGPNGETLRRPVAKMSRTGVRPPAAGAKVRVRGGTWVQRRGRRLPALRLMKQISDLAGHAVSSGHCVMATGRRVTNGNVNPDSGAVRQQQHQHQH